MKYFWKLWLRLNLLTRDIDNDYTAAVSPTGKTLRNADIARLLKDAGSELSYENHHFRLYITCCYKPRTKIQPLN